jgi:hypothetical protein
MHTGIWQAFRSHFSSVPNRHFGPGYWLGASREDVLAIQGSPIESPQQYKGLYNYNCEEWVFSGQARLYFDAGKLVAYDNYRQALHIDSGVKATRRGHFSLGSSTADLLNLHGTPDEIELVNFGPESFFRWYFYQPGEAWSIHADHLVEFSRDGLVCAVTNPAGFLNYKHIPQK